MKKMIHLVLLLIADCSVGPAPSIVVLISANAEWRVIRAAYPDAHYKSTPWGEYFEKEIPIATGARRVLFFHEGWGKVAAAGATQYAIDRWNPEVLINLGTAGGIAGSVQRFEILLIQKTIIYDIREAMGDSAQAIRDYSTTIDLNWLKTPASVRKAVMVSADRDLVPAEIASLRKNYQAIAADWETGAIAYTCQRNGKKLLILRGISDLVNEKSGEAYGKPEVFVNGTEIVMKKLLNGLPEWLTLVGP